MKILSEKMEDEYLRKAGVLVPCPSPQFPDPEGLPDIPGPLHGVEEDDVLTHNLDYFILNDEELTEDFIDTSIFNHVDDNHGNCEMEEEEEAEEAVDLIGIQPEESRPQEEQMESHNRSLFVGLSHTIDHYHPQNPPHPPNQPAPCDCTEQQVPVDETSYQDLNHCCTINSSYSLLNGEGKPEDEGVLEDYVDHGQDYNNNPSNYWYSPNPYAYPPPPELVPPVVGDNQGGTSSSAQQYISTPTPITNQDLYLIINQNYLPEHNAPQYPLPESGVQGGNLPLYFGTQPRFGGASEEPEEPLGSAPMAENRTELNDQIWQSVPCPTQEGEGQQCPFPDGGGQGIDQELGDQHLQEERDQGFSSEDPRIFQAYQNQCISPEEENRTISAQERNDEDIIGHHLNLNQQSQNVNQNKNSGRNTPDVYNYPAENTNYEANHQTKSAPPMNVVETPSPGPAPTKIMEASVYSQVAAPPLDVADTPDQSNAKDCDYPRTAAPSTHVPGYNKRKAQENTRTQDEYKTQEMECLENSGELAPSIDVIDGDEEVSNACAFNYNGDTSNPKVSFGMFSSAVSMDDLSVYNFYGTPEHPNNVGDFPSANFGDGTTGIQSGYITQGVEGVPDQSLDACSQTGSGIVLDNGYFYVADNPVNIFGGAHLYYTNPEDINALDGTISDVAQQIYQRNLGQVYPGDFSVGDNEGNFGANGYDEDTPMINLEAPGDQTPPDGYTCQMALDIDANRYSVSNLSCSGADAVSMLDSYNIGLDLPRSFSFDPEAIGEKDTSGAPRIDQRYFLPSDRLGADSSNSEEASTIVETNGCTYATLTPARSLRSFSELSRPTGPGDPRKIPHRTNSIPLSVITRNKSYKGTSGDFGRRKSRDDDEKSLSSALVGEDPEDDDVFLPPEEDEHRQTPAREEEKPLSPASVILINYASEEARKEALPVNYHRNSSANYYGNSSANYPRNSSANYPRNSPGNNHGRTRKPRENPTRIPVIIIPPSLAISPNDENKIKGEALLQGGEGGSKSPGGGPITCDVCFKRFEHRRYFDRHRLIHSSDRPFKCTQCERAFRQKPHLQVHLLTHSDNKPFKCEYCTSSYIRQNHLENHVLRTHVKNKPIQCSLCSRECFDEAELASHVNIMHNETTYLRFTCDVCQEAFRHIETLKNHLQKEHTRNLWCDRCRTSFDGETGFSLHLSTSRSLRCPECKIIMASPCLLRQHQISHEEASPGRKKHSVSAAEAKRYFQLQSNNNYNNSNNNSGEGRKNSRRSTSGVEERPQMFQCDHCTMCYAQEAHLRYHERTQHRNAVWTCKTCGLLCKTKWFLREHELVHVSPKPFPCGRCDKAYIHQHDLKKHMRTHEGNKPYPCDQCPMSFHTSTHLKRHQANRHCLEKLHKCDQCSNSFLFASELKRHQAYHSEMRPHQCPHCDRAFKMADMLQKHVKRCHGVPLNNNSSIMNNGGAGIGGAVIGGQTSSNEA